MFENYFSIIKAEIAHDLDNRSSVGGFDAHLMKLIQEQLNQIASDSKWLELFIQKKFEFSQYLTLSKNDRKKLILDFRKLLVQYENEMTQDSVISKRLNLFDPAFPKVPKIKQNAFARLGLNSVEDCLRFIPKWVLNRSVITPIVNASKELKPSFMLLQVNSIQNFHRAKKTILKITLKDESGWVTWIWFNRMYLMREFVVGQWIILHDQIENTSWGMQIIGQNGSYAILDQNEITKLKNNHTIVIYSTTPTLTQNFWKEQIDTFLKTTDIKDRFNHLLNAKFMHLSEAFNQIHCPEDQKKFELARRRLALDELVALRFYFLKNKKRLEQCHKLRKYVFNGEKIKKFREIIAFELTKAQQRVLREIREDLANPFPMNRLLQGDVGSGKTIVALISILYAIDSGVQCAFMVPTEILAQQHYKTLKNLLGPLKLELSLLTSESSGYDQKKTLNDLSNGKIELVIGTHALISSNVKFKNLGLLIIDERHKFGVDQRARLEKKGNFPDSLMMTATPFPRAITLTEYGDTNLSVLDERPRGRKTIQTVWKLDIQKQEVYNFIKQQVAKGEQAYFVFPVLDESTMNLKSAVQMFKTMKQEVFHEFHLGLLHGKLSKEEKDFIMQSFLKHEIQILICTTVIEVGIDVKNATVMVIQNAERFGLAQLHQLRGRVGRGEAQSYCFLLTPPRISADAKIRMQAMETIADGFKLSELDLQLRGPGDIFGIHQSGKNEGGILDLFSDIDLISKADDISRTLFNQDPNLSNVENFEFEKFFNNKFKNKFELASFS
jgi:ATP-dependent DNA helicase RecG